jgi:hypothetical protein
MRQHRYRIGSNHIHSIIGSTSGSESTYRVFPGLLEFIATLSRQCRVFSTAQNPTNEAIHPFLGSKIMTTTKERSSVGYRAIVSFVCLLGMSGCVSLDDVTQMSKLADSAQQTLPAVVSDIPASCARRNVLLADIPLSSAERPASLTAQDCKPYRDVADHLTKDQGALIAYFDALGKLASNAPRPYDQTIDTNVATIGKLPSLSNETVAASTAAQTLMKFLADTTTAGYRNREITSLVEKANPPVQELTTDLKKAIVADYAGILSNE